MTDKQTLRREMRAKRRAFVAGLSDAERERLLIDLRDRVLATLPAEGIVAVYSAYGDEIDPVGIADALPGRLAFPAFPTREAPMHFRLWDGGALEDGPLGIPQPPEGATDVEPDIILVPLVAADRRCHRLGQGKGHYDRALDTLKAVKSFHTIGLAWDVQVIDEIPADIWDMPLDAIATPTRWLTPAP